jgi:hypothetical protein
VRAPVLTLLLISYYAQEVLNGLLTGKRNENEAAAIPIFAKFWRRRVFMQTEKKHTFLHDNLV